MIQPIDIAEMQRDFATAFLAIREKAMTPREYVARECERRGIPATDIISKKRDQLTAHARQDMMLGLSETFDLGLSDIGRIFGRDHSTVDHGINAARERRKKKEKESIMFITARSTKATPSCLPKKEFEPSKMTYAEAAKMESMIAGSFNGTGDGAGYVLRAIQKRPGSTPGEISQALGISFSRTAQICRNLYNDRVLMRDRLNDDGVYRYYPRAAQ